MSESPALAGAYDAGVYGVISSTALSAAHAILPRVLELIGPASSAIDFGCGTGGWLAAARDHGIEEVRGVDGPWVDPASLVIAPEEFVAHDLSVPFRADRRFDLAICLEVAGHIPPHREDAFVSSLVRLAPTILFSAPIPNQKGVGRGPFNNRWPAYWAAAFERHDYVWVDCLRPHVWNDPRVVWWYAQNIALVVERGRLAGVQERMGQHPPSSSPLPLVHPDLFDAHANPARLGERGVVPLARASFAAAAQAVRRRLARRRA